MFVVLTDMLKKEKSHTIFSPKIMETCETLNVGSFPHEGFNLEFLVSLINSVYLLINKNKVHAVQ